MTAPVIWGSLCQCRVSLDYCCHEHRRLLKAGDLFATMTPRSGAKVEVVRARDGITHKFGCVVRLDGCSCWMGPYGS